MQTSSHSPAPRHPVLLGLVEAIKVDLIVVPVAFLVATVFWLIGLGSQLPYSIIPEWALALWATVHGLSVSTIGFEFSLAPSLVTLGVWFLLVFGARRLVESIEDTASEGLEEPDAEDERWWADSAIALTTFALAYAAPLFTVAVIVGDVSVTPFGVLRLLLLLLSALAIGFVWTRGVLDIPGLRDIAEETVETVWSVSKRLFWGSIMLSVLVLGVGAILRWDELADAMNAYSAPLSAGIGLIVLQILFAPGILFSALSWLAGTGIDLGAGGLSSVFQSAPGPVPAVPVLEMLVGEYPGWTAAGSALLVLLGIVAMIAPRAHAQRVMDTSWTGLGLSLAMMWLGLQTVSLFATGAMGPLGLSDFGPPALTSAVAVTAWLGLGMSAGLGLTKLSQMQNSGESDHAAWSEESGAWSEESEDPTSIPEDPGPDR